MSEITKAIVPIAGLGTRFFPLSSLVPKEFWPLVDRPMLQYIVEEAKAAGISHVIFVGRPQKSIEVLKYFKSGDALKRVLRTKKKSFLSEDLKGLHELSEGLHFSVATQKIPHGDGHAILQAKKLVGREPCGVFFSDDIIFSSTPALSQLIKVFKTCQKPVVALKTVPKEKLSSYGIVQTERIAHRLYKIKKIIEKPEINQAPSDLAIVGRHILTPEVFNYLQQAQPNSAGEVVLAEILNRIIESGGVVYGYEIEGEWLECGTKKDWLKSNFFLGLKHPKWSKDLKQYIKDKGLT